MSLFREWCEVVRYLPTFPSSDDDDPEWVATLARIDDLEAAIADTPAAGPAVLAIKVYLHCYVEHATLSDNPGGLGEDGHISQTEISAIKDAVRFVPELAPLCAAALEEREDEIARTRLATLAGAAVKLRSLRFWCTNSLTVLLEGGGEDAVWLRQVLALIEREAQP